MLVLLSGFVPRLKTGALRKFLLLSVEHLPPRRIPTVFKPNVKTHGITPYLLFFIMTTLAKPTLKSLRQPQLLSDFGPTIWETHSLVDSDGDFLDDMDYDREDVIKDIQDMLGYSDDQIKRMRNLDFIQLVKDCAGVQIIFYRGHTLEDERLIEEIEPALESAAALHCWDY